MAGPVVYILGGTAAFFVVLLLMVELLFVFRPNFTVTTAKCLLLSQLVAFCVVLPTLLFTNHPWGSGVGVLGYFFLLPPSLIAGCSVRLLYGSGDRPVLGKRVTLTVAALGVIGLLAWLLADLPKHLSKLPPKRVESSPERYSARDKSEAQALLDSYWSQGIIQRCRSHDHPAAICVDGVRWKGLSKDMQATVFRKMMKSYAVLGYNTDVEIVDKQSGEIYATSRPGTTGVELEIR